MHLVPVGSSTSGSRGGVPVSLGRRRSGPLSLCGGGSSLELGLLELTLGAHDRGGIASLPGSSGGSLLSGEGAGLLLLLKLLEVSVEEEIDRDLPWLLADDGTTHAVDLAGKKPVHKANGKLGLVVARDGAIDVLKRRVGVTQADDGDTNVGSLLDGLGVNAGISDDEKTGLSELLGHLIGESTRGEASGDALRTSVLGELKDSTLTERTAGDGDNVGRVLDGSDDTGSEHKLLPGLAEVEDVETVGAVLPDVVLHLCLGVVGTNVDTGGQHLLHVVIPVNRKSEDK